MRPAPIPPPDDAAEPATQAPVLFFDGQCGLCNRSVDWLLRHDRRAVLRFAPLQGVTAAQRLPADRVAALDTLVLLTDGRTLVRSEAVLEALVLLGGPWRVAAALARLVPRPLRDLAYDVIARHRQRWFGRLAACRVPTPAERERFLP